MTTPSYLNTEELQKRLDDNLAFFWAHRDLLVEE